MKTGWDYYFLSRPDSLMPLAHECKTHNLSHISHADARPKHRRVQIWRAKRNSPTCLHTYGEATAILNKALELELIPNIKEDIMCK